MINLPGVWVADRGWGWGSIGGQKNEVNLSGQLAARSVKPREKSDSQSPVSKPIRGAKKMWGDTEREGGWRGGWGGVDSSAGT